MLPVPNAQYGAEQMEQLTAQVLEQRHGFHSVIIGLESTGFYGVHIASYLSTCERLAPFSTKVCCLNPKEVAKYKESFNSLDKNDGTDSFVIADFARVGRIKIQPWRGAQYPALQRRTRHRLHITECIAREKTYMLNNIFLKFSQFAMPGKEEHPFSNKYGAAAEAVLTDCLSTEAIVNASVDELIAFISSKSRGRISDPEQTAYLLQKAAKDSYRLDKCLYEPLTVSVGVLLTASVHSKRSLRPLMMPF